jgi:hypothetical protein
MIILQLSHGLTLISSCTSQREAISEKTLSSSRFSFLLSWKTLQSNLSWLHKTFLGSMTLRERLPGDRSSLISELESKMFLEYLPMRQRLVKLPGLRLTFSSSSKLDESSLEKLKSLKVAHTHDMIFWNFFFLLSLKRCFFLSFP